ncbi:MAG TPA: SIMPL domain-containing protein [Mycobacterium sp.]|nr:SIMPL domain-containing protein [Mycobacterium sp.]
MTVVEINVRGAHTVTLAPERATIHATVGMEGPAPEPVFEAVAAGLAEVARSLDELHHPKRGPVTWYAVDQVRRGSHRPWNDQGEQLPLVYSATVSIAAKFRDFDELARWVAWSATVEGLSIGYVHWALTERRRLEVERKTRRNAVRDARRRAQDYADALDLGPVSVREISDTGLGRPDGPAPRPMRAAAPAPGGDAPEFVLRPEDVKISAHVEASFSVAHRR